MAISASEGLDLIESSALATSMRAAGHTVRSLASKLDVDKAMIGRLRSGRQARCLTRVAWAIEKELRVPAGQLFSVPSPSRVSQESSACETSGEEVPAA